MEACTLAEQNFPSVLFRLRVREFARATLFRNYGKKKETVVLTVLLVRWQSSTLAAEREVCETRDIEPGTAP